MDTLDTIIRETRARVRAQKAQEPLASVRARAEAMEPCRGLVSAMRRPRATPAIIAEVKRKSPSAGWMRPEYADEGFAPEAIAEKYERAGASAISCLTDGPFFGGHASYIQRIKGRVGLPVLRKDFVVDVWQVFESRAIGADGVLLMAECLGEGELEACASAAAGLGLDVLLEIHDEANLARAVRVFEAHPGRMLLGINNRDLATMRVDVSQTERLAAMVPDAGWLVSESGIREPGDLARLGGVGVRMALVGEHLMKQPDPGAALAALLGT